MVVEHGLTRDKQIIKSVDSTSLPYLPKQRTNIRYLKQYQVIFYYAFEILISVIKSRYLPNSKIPLDPCTQLKLELSAEITKVECCYPRTRGWHFKHGVRTCLSDMNQRFVYSPDRAFECKPTLVL